MKHLISFLSLLLIVCGLVACGGETPETETPEVVDTETVAPAPAAEATTSGPVGWSRTAADLAGSDGDRFTFECTGPFQSASVWGTKLYTDDSSICVAAVHAGVIDQSGGEVTIELRPGAESYYGSTSGEINSSDYGTFDRSFVVVGDDGQPIEPEAIEGRVLPWSETGASLEGAAGDRFEVTCPPNGRLGSVWGSDVYTDDSSVCTAAVHAGVITTAGGPVTVEIRKGQSSYEGVERNGVQSSSYGEWERSFAFVQQ